MRLTGSFTSMCGTTTKGCDVQRNRNTTMGLHTTIPSFFYYSSDREQIALKMPAIFIAEVTPECDGFSLQLGFSSKNLINTLQSALSGYASWNPT
jgi:hypothetical protein